MTSVDDAAKAQLDALGLEHHAEDGAPAIVAIAPSIAPAASSVDLVASTQPHAEQLAGQPMPPAGVLSSMAHRLAVVALLFDCRLDADDVKALEDVDGADWSWARGVSLSFTCDACGRTQPASPPGGRGITSEEAEQIGWRIGHGDSVLCPAHAAGVVERAASAAGKPASDDYAEITIGAQQTAAAAAAPSVDPPAPRTRKSWRGSFWCEELIPDGEA